jgi:hypothetical protein
MPDLVRNYLDLPEHATLDSFIVKPESPDAVLAKQYAITAVVRPKLSKLLDEIKYYLDHGESVGRFVYGSFGSGKSHFIRVLGMMLQNDPALYVNATDPAFAQLRGERPWLETSNVLFVPVMMMGADNAPDAFPRWLIGAFNRRLQAFNRPTLDVYPVDATLAAFDQAIAETPEFYSAFQRRTGLPRAAYDTIRQKIGSDERLELARKVCGFTTNDRGRFDPTGAEAREAIAAHAQSLGYRAVAFGVDEFVLWAQGISGGNYIAAVNALNALVESSDQRKVPFIVLAAIQRSITEVFPDDRSETPLREQLDRVTARFPQITLEDSNLYEIAHRRVLRPKPDRAAAWSEVVRRSVAALNAGDRSVLLVDEDPEALALLYPLHPALVMTLSNLTQGLQRERSSLFMLYQLLTEIRPELETGQLVSLGALWDALFSEDNLSLLDAYAPKDNPQHASRQLLAIHAAWHRLQSAIRASKDPIVLDLLLKAALLWQAAQRGARLSQAGRDPSITIERLVRLNRADVGGVSEGFGVRRARQLLVELQKSEPDAIALQGSDAETRVVVELSAVDVRSLIAQIHPSFGDRFKALLRSATAALGVERVVTSGQEGVQTFTWRGTEHRARIRFESFDRLETSGKNNMLAVAPNDDAKLIVLLEDDPDASVAQQIANARQRLESAREEAQSYAAVWIPTPLSAVGRAALDRLAKLTMFFSNPDRYLAGVRPADHENVRVKLESLRGNDEDALRDALRAAYGDASQILTLQRQTPQLYPPPNTAVDDRAVLIAKDLVQQRYRLHPEFRKNPNVSALNLLLQTHERLRLHQGDNTLAGDEKERVEAIGIPLELFNPGLGVSNLRPTSMYLEALKQWIAKGQPGVKTFVDQFAAEPYGLPREVAQFLIAILALREDYRVVVDGRTRALESISDVSLQATLAKGDLPPAATWATARANASTIFGISDAPTAHAIASVDALALALRDPLAATLKAIERCVAALRRLTVHDETTSFSDALVKRYETARKTTVELQDDSQQAARLASVSVEEYGAAVKAAATDANALESLVSLAIRDVVVRASPELKANLEATLASTELPVVPRIKTWESLALDWNRAAIEQQIAARKSGSTSTEVVQPGSPVGVVKAGGDLVICSITDASKPEDPGLMSSVAAADVEALLAQIRARIDQALAASPSGAVTVSIRIEKAAPSKVLQ